MNFIIIISISLFIICFLLLLYMYLLVFGAIHVTKKNTCKSVLFRFAIAIPAHNEEEVIAATIHQIRNADYPKEKVDVYVVADNCSDQTTIRAKDAGAVVYERNEGPRGSKGAALRWLFMKILANEPIYDAIIIFDADSKMDPDFLSFMGNKLQSGEVAIQGNHIISNPQDGWFSALTWAMFLIDNRFQNQGRSNLGLSAKNMGDGICFSTAIIKKLGWGEGLTEDYAFRQMLLLENIRIDYEPNAKSYGQAPWSWLIAEKQRLRWIRGAQSASLQHRKVLLKKGIKNKNYMMIDGALQGYLPSYSTLTLLTFIVWLFHILFFAKALFFFNIAWSVILLMLFLYPLFGLVLEKAPLNAFIAILSGPFFILWRTWLSVSARTGLKQIIWIRTPHRGNRE